MWALIFNFKSEKETIYAQQMGEDGQEYVITWQEREDAVRYGGCFWTTHTLVYCSSFEYGDYLCNFVFLFFSCLPPAVKAPQRPLFIFCAGAEPGPV